MKFMSVKRALAALASRYLFAKSVVIRAKSGVTNTCIKPDFSHIYTPQNRAALVNFRHRNTRLYLEKT
jgi:hypothetical protein